VIVQCRQDELNQEVVIEVPNEKYTEVSFLISVSDAEDEPIEAVQISIVDNNEIVSTDENGVALLQLSEITGFGSLISITKEGYVPIQQLVSGGSNSTRELKVQLSKPTITIIATGEEKAIGKGKLALPDVLMYADGVSFSGSVEVRSVYLDPDNQDFLEAAPGDLLALNSNDEYLQLASLGMYSIELFDESGRELQIPDGQKATITFPIADSNRGIVPNEVPLWYFDEDNGLWVEDGTAITEGDEMIAEVSHFTWWNCDLPYKFSPICLMFADLEGAPIAGLEVHFSVNGAAFGFEFTDDAGNILGNMPLGQVIEISIFHSGVFYGTQEIGPFNGTEKKIKIEVDVEFFTVSGLAVDCNMNPLEEGYGAAIHDNWTFYFPIVDGMFSFVTTQEGPVEIKIVDLINGWFVDDFYQIEGDTEIGTVVVCEGAIESSISGTVEVDLDGDGIYDDSPEGIVIKVQGGAGIDTEVVTDEDGYYSIVVPAGLYSVLPDLSGQNLYSLGKDNTPDGDPDDWTQSLIKSIIVEENEADTANDFIIFPQYDAVVSGTVMVDTDGDGVGDEPASGFTVVQRSDGFISGVEVSISTDVNGSYSFPTRSLSMFGIIAITQTPDIEFVSDYDHTPDPDGDDTFMGPDGRIPYQLQFEETDSDNNFVIRYQ